MPLAPTAEATGLRCTRLCRFRADLPSRLRPPQGLAARSVASRTRGCLLSLFLWSAPWRRLGALNSRRILEPGNSTSPASPGRVAPIPALHALRRQVKCAAIDPGRDGWDAATQAFNPTLGREPALVALAADEEEVINIVELARVQRMQVAAQRTGHNAEPLGALDDVILVKTDGLQGVEIDVQRGIARAGANWANVVPLASEFGLAASARLDSGRQRRGLLARRRRRLVRAQARPVHEHRRRDRARHADYTFRRVNQDDEPNLLWALRCGGGNLGIVTALEVQLYSIPDIYAGLLILPVGALRRGAARVARVDREDPGRADVARPDPSLPAHPECPGAAAGKQVRRRRGVYMGDEATGADLMRPVHDLGPAIDTFTFAMVEPVGVATCTWRRPRRCR